MATIECAVITTADHYREFEERGFEGQTLEALVSRAAPARALSRERAIVHSLHDRAIRLVVTTADAIGIGGKDDLGSQVDSPGGESTTRMPLLRAFGSGRKNAGDGGAWSAAIQKTRDDLVSNGYKIVPGDPVRVISPEGEITPIGWDTLPPRWARALSYAAAIAVAYNPDGESHQVRGRGGTRAPGDPGFKIPTAHPFGGTTSEWCEVFSRATEALENWDSSMELTELPEEAIPEWEKEVLAAGDE